MSFQKVAILTSKTSWFVPYAKKFITLLRNKKYSATLFYKHEDINEKFEIVFILSYFRIIKTKYLRKHRYNLVVHESNLPKGKGWSPLFWQILDGKNKIPVVLFNATSKVDEGKIYIQDHIKLKGNELNEEIRKIQAEKSIELCLMFLNKKNNLMPKKQKGKTSFYRKRVVADSELDINKNLKEQFNLLRIVDNEEFPAFFYYNKNKYILKIYKIKK